MTPPTMYDRSAVPVRRDLAAIHEQLLRHLVAPGTWWSGPERRAIAEAARCAPDCPLCAQRTAAISPFAANGRHLADDELEPDLVDVIHRIVTDPGRLTTGWYDGVVEAGTLDHERYVELVSVTLHLCALDVFARAIGVGPAPLPPAEPGLPTRRRPEHADDDRAWVPRLRFVDGHDPDWQRLFGDRTQVAEVELGLSLVPAEMAVLNEVADVQYLAFRHVPDPTYARTDRAIDRLQTELVASRVSSINECFY